MEQINKNVVKVLSSSEASRNAGLRELEAPKYKCKAPIIGGLRAEPPAGSRGRAPSEGVKLKHFGFWTFTESRKFAYF